MSELGNVTFSSLISSGTHVDYAILDLSAIRALRIENYIYEDVRLIDVFQDLNSDYLFLKVTPAMVTSVLSFINSAIKCLPPLLQIPVRPYKFLHY